MIEHWTEFVIGIMIIISPWVFGFSDISVARWCNVLLGLALVVVNAWMLFGESARMAPAMSTTEESQKGKRKSKNNVEQK